MPPLHRPLPLPIRRFLSQHRPSLSSRTQSEPPEAPDASAGGEQHHFGRSRVDSREAPTEEERKLAGWMKKSASKISTLAHFEDAEIVRRPAARGCARKLIVDEELEVDARVDDLILS